MTRAQIIALVALRRNGTQPRPRTGDVLVRLGYARKVNIAHGAGYFVAPAGIQWVADNWLTLPDDIKAATLPSYGKVA